MLADYLVIGAVTSSTLSEYNENHLLLIYDMQTGERVVENEYDHLDNIYDRTFNIDVSSDRIYCTGLTSPTLSASDTTNLILLRYDVEIIVNTEAIATTKNKTISIYPNPTKTAINIFQEQNSTIFHQYEIINSEGKIIEQGELNYSKEKLNLENLSLSSGTYYIQLKNEKSSLTEIHAIIIK